MTSLSTLLFLESELKKRQSLSSKVDLISNYDKFSDIKEIISNIPGIYVEPLMIGIESEIKEEAQEARRKHKIEVRMKENKSLNDLIHINKIF